MDNKLHEKLEAAIDVLIDYRDSLVGSYTIRFDGHKHFGFIDELEERENIAKLNELISTIKLDDDKGMAELPESIPDELRYVIVGCGHDYKTYRDATGNDSLKEALHE